jgi:hypothetical protein
MKQRAVLRPYLDGLESLLVKYFPRRSGKLVNLTRFADDCAPRRRGKEVIMTT